VVRIRDLTAASSSSWGARDFLTGGGWRLEGVAGRADPGGIGMARSAHVASQKLVAGVLERRAPAEHGRHAAESAILASYRSVAKRPSTTPGPGSTASPPPSSSPHATTR
jgi:hypothetical protein